MRKKYLPSMITSIRIFLSPAIYLLIVGLDYKSRYAVLIICLFWLLFIIIELSDLLDGIVARKLLQTSDFGKVFDPFADSFSRLTYFFSFVSIGIMEPAIFLIVLYRDLLVNFGRLILAKKGICFSAKISGKLKACIYAFAGVAGLVRITLPILTPTISTSNILYTSIDLIFLSTAIVAIYTAMDYLLDIYRTFKRSTTQSVRFPDKS